MTELTPVTVIRERLGDADAMRAVADVVGSAKVAIERRLYYPFHWYRVSGSAPALFARRPLTLECLVDARIGQASTADPFAVVRDTVPAGALLPPERDSQDAEREARRYASHALGRGLRTIASFELELEHRGVVHKAFWLMRCDGHGVLLDTTNGELQLLRH